MIGALLLIVRASAAATTSCVTGATGYLASELVAQLLEEGHTVRATVRSLANPSRVAYLQALPSASDHLTLLEADLLVDGSFDACVAGAGHVYHTASPFVTVGITDPDTQLLAPALNGTRNLFASIRRAVEAGGDKPRVVLTSSIAAVMGKPTDKQECFDEDDWNFSSRPDGGGLDSYRYSKLAAEKEAWKLAAEMGLHLATVLPSFIVGPPRTSRVDGESLRNMHQALQGETPHRGDTPMVDVRDCAAAHIAAAASAAAAGKRFLTTSAQAVPRDRLLELLRAAYPHTQIAEGGTADARAWREGRVIFCGKNLASLGLEVRDAETSLLDMAAVMLEKGVVQPKPLADAASKAEL